MPFVVFSFVCNGVACRNWIGTWTSRANVLVAPIHRSLQRYFRPSGGQMGEPMNKQEFRAEGSTEQHSTQPAAGIAVLKQVSQAPPTGAHKDKGARRATHDDLMNDQLMDAEALINYAADVGIPIADDVRRQVLGARQAAVGGWTEDRSIKLLSALTKLSASLKPVSGESLRKCVPEEA